MKTRAQSGSQPSVAGGLLPLLLTLLIVPGVQLIAAEPPPLPEMVDSNLRVRAAVSGLPSPTSMAFLGPNDLLVLEKETGRVRRVINGTVQTTPVLDLPVNYASERGLLGIALHPRFRINGAVFLFWTESSVRADTDVLSQTPLLGNRVDRFHWNGATLTHEMNVIRLRALQEDAGQPPRGNHDGGILRFGPDGKLYIYMGDNGRRGQMQNLPDGHSLEGNMPDDQFGGPEPDNAHLTGVILRLDDDGRTPIDNPFHSAGAKRGGEAGANLQKVFAYGIRNGFGMAFDPVSGALWEAQNGDDSFTELNLVERGSNLGWIQVMGPLERISQFKAIETSEQFFGLQQLRWPPTRIADTAQEALARMFMVYDGGDAFGSVLTGAEENPPVNTAGRAVAHFKLQGASLSYEVWAQSALRQVTAAHIHLGAHLQNGPIVAMLLNSARAPRNFAAGELIARGTLADADIMARSSFRPFVANLAERMRQGRAYVNVHTVAHPEGEVRGQVTVLDRDPVSHYSDPEFSWKFEVAPAALGFIASRALGPQYEHDMVVGAARNVLFEGQLFRFQLTGNRTRIVGDTVADNTAKHDITESENRLFGTGFGVGTDITTGPNGNLFVVSLTHGIIYEIFRRPTGNGR
jgi:glucose/arabinose dehydrogenase